MRRRRAAFVAIVAGAAAVAVGRVWADGAAPPDTIVPRLERGQPAYVGLETTFGYLEAIDGHTFTWVCHDTLLPSGSGIPPGYFPSPDGSHILATVRSLHTAKNANGSLYDSPDAGCSWNAIHSIDGAIVEDVAWDPTRPLRALAAQAGDGAGGPSALWATSDGGVTFAKIPSSVTAQTFTTVEFAPGDPSTAYAASNDVGAGTASIWRSADGGTSWTQAPFGVAGQFHVYLSAVSPTNASLVWLRTYDLPETIFRSTNGGASFGATAGTPAGIESFGITTAGLPAFTTSRSAGTFVARDGLTFTHVAGGPHGRGFGWDGRGEWEASDDYGDGYALALAAVGTTAFAPVFEFKQLTGPKSCPAGTDVATICPPLWPAMEIKLGITTPVPSPSPSPSPTPGNGGGGSGGCGCDLGGGAGSAREWGIAIATLVALGALLAKRHRSRRP